MKVTKLALTMLCSMLLFCACTKNSDVVIKVNEDGITRGEFYSDFDKIKNAQFKNAPKEFQKDDSYPVLILKDRFVNDVIVRKLLAQEYTKRNITASKEEIEAKKATIIEQVGSEEQLKRILSENNISDEKFNEDMASEVKIEKLIDELGGAKVTEKDAQNYYNKNKSQFTFPERVQVSHILIDTNPEVLRRKVTDSDKEGKMSGAQVNAKVKELIQQNRALAQEISTKLKSNPDNFAKLAEEYSQDVENAKRGGDLGYIQKGQMVPEFERVAFAQKIGVVSEPFDSPYGTHIIIVKDKTKPGLQPYAKVKNDLINMLIARKKGEVLGKFIDGLRNTAKIEYLDSSLNPENIKKQAEEALKKQIEREKKAGVEPKPPVEPDQPTAKEEK